MTLKSLLPSLWDKENYEPFHSLQREIDRVFNDFSRGDFSRGAPFPLAARNGNGATRLMPSVDVSETESALEVTTELPGVDEKDIEVTLSEHVLTIKGEKKAESEKGEKNYHMVERSYGSFHRSLTVPFEAAADEIEAKFENGVLKVTLPKPPEIEAKTRKIPVHSAA